MNGNILDKLKAGEAKAWGKLPSEGYIVWAQHPGGTSWCDRTKGGGVSIFVPGTLRSKPPVSHSKAHAEAIRTDVLAMFKFAPEVVRVLDLSGDGERPAFGEVSK